MVFCADDDSTQATVVMPFVFVSVHVYPWAHVTLLYVHPHWFAVNVGVPPSATMCNLANSAVAVGISWHQLAYI